MTRQDPSAFERGLYDAADGGARMVFDETFPWPLRLLLGAFGLMTFVAPWDLLIRPGHPFELGKLPFWFLSLGALSIGVPLLAAAVAGPERTLAIDFDRGLFVETTRFAFGWVVARSRRFADLDRLEVVEQDWSDGPSEWRLAARFAATAKPWPIRTLRSRAAAEALRDEIAERLAAARV
jgi:hypothetical protein